MCNERVAALFQPCTVCTSRLLIAALASKLHALGNGYCHLSLNHWRLVALLRRDLVQQTSMTSLVYGAFVLAVLNVVEKFVRLSMADPWLHAEHADGYPLLYMRSNAARLPRALQLDFIFR